MAEVSDPSSKKKASSPLKKWVILGLKLAISAAGLYYVYGQLVGKDGWDELSTRLSELKWHWFVAAMLMQSIAICFAVARWKTMLGGQGLHARWGFLFPSFMIGRFWGAFTPGGLGLDGWKLYDVATQTKKHARTIAVTTAEKILGQLAFGIVVMGASIWGLELMGVSGLLMINAFFVVLVSAGLTFISRPKLFLPLFKLLPRQIESRIQTLITAVTAFHGKGRILAVATLHGVAVHAFNNMIYVCAALAMQLPVTSTVVFFASSIVIMSTIVPLSFNGIGVREATAAGVLASMGGVSPGIAAATYTLGWVAEMCVSAFGIPVFLARRAGYDAKIDVEDADREQAIEQELPPVPMEKWPSRARGLAIGAGAGLLAGMIVGIVEAVVVVHGGNGNVSLGVIWYGALVYGIVCAIGGAGMVFASAWLGRLMKREAVPEPHAYARTTAFFVSALAFALTAFRIRRDVFHEELVWKSANGLLVLAACAAGAVLLYLALSLGFRALTSHRFGRFMLRAWGSPAIAGAVIGGLVVVALTTGAPANAEPTVQRGAAPENAPNVLVIVVDTLRADHLPAYGYENGRTPNLDRFAQDAIRFDRAYANASWTRPSFASILTGRYASSHTVMAKEGPGSALPDALVTMPEALRSHGYHTAGVVTNHNVAPFYNFHQGFDSYAYLEPDFVLGADDTAAKLLLVQALRQQIARVRGLVPGTVYQDAPVVNRSVFAALDQAPRNEPWFMFVGYMDPHDPYYTHPYEGVGYDRAGHQEPDLDEAPRLRELYDGEITYWDEHFGRLIAELRRRGVYDDTMIVVTSDHGEEFGEHGGFWHGTTLYDEQLHVPLFVKLPRSERAGTNVGHWVQSVDIMPTILAQIGVQAPAGVQGGMLHEGSERLFAEESHEGNVLASVRERREFEELKIITANADNPRGLAPVEVYRLADDPGEQTNAADADRTTTQALVRSVGEARRDAARGAVERRGVDRDDEDLQIQCSLGYADTRQCCRRGYLTGPACRGT